MGGRTIVLDSLHQSPYALREHGVSQADLLAAIRCGRNGITQACNNRVIPGLGASRWLAQFTGVTPDLENAHVLEWAEVTTGMSILSGDIPPDPEIITGVTLVMGRVSQAALVSEDGIPEEVYSGLWMEVIRFLCLEFGGASPSEYIKLVLGGCLALRKNILPDSNVLGRQVIAALLLFNNLFALNKT